MAADNEQLNGAREAVYANWLGTLKAPDHRGGGWTEGFQLAGVSELLEIRLGKLRQMKPWLEGLGSIKPNPLSTTCTFEDVSRLALVQRLGRGSHSPAVRAGIKRIVQRDAQIHQAQAVVIGGRSDPEWLRVISNQEGPLAPNLGTVEVIRRDHILDLSERAIELALPTVPIDNPTTNPIESPESPKRADRLTVRDLRVMIRDYIDDHNDWGNLVQQAGVPDDLTGRMFQLLCARDPNPRSVDATMRIIQQDPNALSSLRQMARILEPYANRSATD